jgi:hypothetical protein
MGWNKTPILCKCGSGKDRFDLEDAAGIFVNYVCDDCEEEVKSRYRPEVFADPDYWSDEPKDWQDD